jgi:hypothetical protein
MIQVGVGIVGKVELKALRTSNMRRMLANAMMRTLEEAQRAQQDLVGRRFIDRQNRGFLKRMVKIGSDDRPTPDRLVGRIRIIGPEGAEDRKNLLLKHEEGGVRTTGGGFSIDPSVRVKGVFWLPTRAIRASFSDTVPRRLYPASLHLTESRYEGTTRKGKKAGYAGVHRTSSGKLQLKGSDRTFLIMGANGGRPIGIFQRSGRSKWGGAGRSGGKALGWNKHGGGWHTRDDIRLIWAFKPRITLKPRLEFKATVPRVLQDRMPINYAGFMAKALEGAR